MGGDSGMPYLYTPTNRPVSYPYSNFNPKAVTEASYARLSQQTFSSTSSPKKEGPLINFNQHPDSYVVVTGNQKEYKPCPPGTKKAVVSVRWVQFALRVLQEICALGLLVATICIKSTSGAETYLLRIPQAWDSLITLYAVYHLLRPAKGRPPGSSAAYHSFALVMDVALIPLYVYITLLVNNNRHLPLAQYNDSGHEVEGNWRWSSFFATNSTYTLLLCTFIGAAVLAGLHFLSIGLDVYLIIAFRKINSLPPDMNPLEDNLTSRRMTKHKHKNSEMTLTSNDSTAELDEKRRSVFSVANQSRLSVAAGNDSINEAAPRLPFAHSRTGSNTNLAYSPHTQESARRSRHEFDGQQDVYQQAITNPRKSRYEIRADGKLDVRTRRGSQSPSKRGSMRIEAEPNYLNPRTASSLAPTTNPSSRDGGEFSDTFEMPPADRIASPPPEGYRTSPRGSPANPNAAGTRDGALKEQKSGLLNDNWYVLDAEDEDLGSPSPSRQRTPAPEYGHHGYAPAPLHDRHDSFEPTGRADGVSVRDMQVPLKPLGMHPPTPPMPETEYPDADTQEAYDASGVNRSLTVASQATNSSSVYSESAPSLDSSPVRSGTPKGRYYGDLAAAQRGVRGGQQAQTNLAYVQPGPMQGLTYGLPPSPQPSRTPSPDKRGSRVISRTGADIADENVLYVPESKSGMRSRREVSGKVAEEGRGGSWGRRAY